MIFIRFLISYLAPLVVFLPRILMLTFSYCDFEGTEGRLFQTRVVCTNWISTILFTNAKKKNAEWFNINKKKSNLVLTTCFCITFLRYAQSQKNRKPSSLTVLGRPKQDKARRTLVLIIITLLRNCEFQ